MKHKTMILKDFAGQRCDVEINQRQDGTIYLCFKSEYGFGFPYIDEGDLHYLVRKIESFKD